MKISTSSVQISSFKSYDHCLSVLLLFPKVGQGHIFVSILNKKRKFTPDALLPICEIYIYRGSYMSAHVLLNLLNELGKRDKMRGLRSILSLFRNEFNKFNNTRARMLDSIYHMTNTLKSHFWRKNVIILSLCTQRYYGRHNVSRKSINH